jgi:hypothetical protein
MNEADQVFPYFFATWVVLGLISFAFFQFNKDADLKRKVWPVVVVGTGVLFVTFVWLMGFRGGEMYVVVPAITLITALNLRAVKFCDSCGATLYYGNLFVKMEYCPKCGSKLP